MIVNKVHPQQDQVAALMAWPKGQPDVILLVEYPSVENFLAMANSDAYKVIAHDRSIALEFGGLLACNPLN
ncbi:MAG: hypothetical protein AAGG75_24760 [Bacteroidota bacterium]